MRSLPWRSSSNELSNDCHAVELPTPRWQFDGHAYPTREVTRMSARSAKPRVPWESIPISSRTPMLDSSKTLATCSPKRRLSSFWRASVSRNVSAHVSFCSRCATRRTDRLMSHDCRTWPTSRSRSGIWCGGVPRSVVGRPGTVPRGHCGPRSRRSRGSDSLRPKSLRRSSGPTSLQLRLPFRVSWPSLPETKRMSTSICAVVSPTSGHYKRRISRSHRDPW